MIKLSTPSTIIIHYPKRRGRIILKAIIMFTILELLISHRPQNSSNGRRSISVQAWTMSHHENKNHYKRKLVSLSSSRFHQGHRQQQQLFHIFSATKHNNNHFGKDNGSSYGFPRSTMTSSPSRLFGTLPNHPNNDNDDSQQQTQKNVLDDNEAQVYQELKSVAQTILHHDSLYYTPGIQPEITDDEYDALVQREVELCTSYPHLLHQWQIESKLGHQATRYSGRVGKLLLQQQEEEETSIPTLSLSDRRKRQHLSPMLSLDNITNKEQLIQWLHRIRKYIIQHNERRQEEEEEIQSSSSSSSIKSETKRTTELVMTTEPKLDGLSLSIRYQKQQLDTKNDPVYQMQWASTRGDGIQGQDVTHAILHDMNHTIPSTFKLSSSSSNQQQQQQLPSILEIRGEVVLPSTIFHEKLVNRQQQFSNARNAASGILLRIQKEEKKKKNNNDENDTTTVTDHDGDGACDATTISTKVLRSYLQFYAYDVVMLEEDLPFTTLSTNHLETQSMLQQIGFRVPEPIISTTIPLFNTIDNKNGDDEHDLSQKDEGSDSETEEQEEEEEEWDTTHAIEPLLEYYNALMKYRLSKESNTVDASSATNFNKTKKNNINSKYIWGDYDMDGAVHKVSDHTLRHIIGSHTRSPRWAVAHKFPPTSAVTELQGLEIQVGRTGALTPVAILKPIEIDGVIIQRATLHNFGHAQHILSRPSNTDKDEAEEEMSSTAMTPKRIPQNCSVIVRRAGDVIPQVVRRVFLNDNDINGSEKISEERMVKNNSDEQNLVLESSSTSSSSWISLDAPPKCPACGSDTFLDNAAGTGRSGATLGQVLRCGGPPLLCPPRAVAALAHAYSRDAMDIKGLSEARIEQLIQAELLQVPSDLFRFVVASGNDNDTNDDDDDNNKENKTLLLQERIEDLPGWGSKSVKNLVQEAKRIATEGISLQRYIFSLGIRHVGKNTSKVLASTYGTVDNFLKAIDTCSILQQEQQSLVSVAAKEGEELASDADDNNNTDKIIYFPELTGTEDTEGVKDIGPVTISSLVAFSQEDALVRSAKELAQAILVHDVKDALSTAISPPGYNDSLSLPLQGMTIVFTGSFPDMKREEAQELAKRMGAKSTPGSISKSTDILVAGDKVGPKKIEKATTLGIRILSPTEFLDMVNEVL